MSILTSGARSTLARTGVSLVLAATAVGGLATVSEAATTVPVITLSATTGPRGGGNTLTLTLPSTATTKYTNGAVGVVFQATTPALMASAACGAATSGITASATNIIPTGTDVRYLATTKVSALVPDLGVTTTNWLVCAYNKAESGGNIPSAATVLGRATYVVAQAPTFVSMTPTSGPALGGQTVTITGTNFPPTISATAPLTATLGGAAMTGVTAVSDTVFTAVTPARPASATAATLTVTTNGGTYTTGVGTNVANPYTYQNGITISPNTVPSGSPVDVDVQGVGFNALTFDTTDGTMIDDANAHVYLVDGAYSATGWVAGTTDKPTPEVTECIDVAVISDAELICTLDASSSAPDSGTGVYTYGGTDLTEGTYTMTVVNSGAAVAPTYLTVVSSGATFTVSDF